MDAQRKFETFEDLEVYQVARAFRIAMYAVTRKLPDFEKYELASQIRRAAVSLTNNIAEGHGRFHYLDQIKFLLQARGSLQELMDDLNVCVDEGYLLEQQANELKAQGWRVAKLTGGYIRYLRQRKTGESLVLREEPPRYGASADEFDVLVESFGDLTPEGSADSTIQPFNDSTP